MEDVRKALPAEPSRKSGRWYMFAIIALAALEALISAWKDYHGWQVLAVVDGAVVFAYAIASTKSGVDLNKWIDSAKEIALAKMGGGQ